MRLIDVDELEKTKIWSEEEQRWVIPLSSIISQPTGYDIDKVVKKLEKEKDIHTEHFHISIYKDMPEIKQRYEQAIGIIDRAIEIVKQGVKEQNNTCFDCKYHYMSDCYLECQIKDRINNDNICKNFEKLKEQNK